MEATIKVKNLNKKYEGFELKILVLKFQKVVLLD